MAKKKPARQWIRVFSAGPGLGTAPDPLKAEVSRLAQDLIDRVLTPRYIKGPHKIPEFNYPIALWSKWRGRFFTFGSTWASPGPNRIAPTFELPFARLEWAGGRTFHMAYFRHTGKWWQIRTAQPLEECMREVEAGGHFAPPV
jgi:hypothetical protein